MQPVRRYIACTEVGSRGTLSTVRKCALSIFLDQRNPLFFRFVRVRLCRQRTHATTVSGPGPMTSQGLRFVQLYRMEFCTTVRYSGRKNAGFPEVCVCGLCVRGTVWYCTSSAHTVIVWDARTRTGPGDQSVVSSSDCSHVRGLPAVRAGHLTKDYCVRSVR